jgi:hypothetical protein
VDMLLVSDVDIFLHTVHYVFSVTVGHDSTHTDEGIHIQYEVSFLLSGALVYIMNFAVFETSCLFFVCS